MGPLSAKAQALASLLPTSMRGCCTAGFPQEGRRAWCSHQLRGAGQASFPGLLLTLLPKAESSSVPRPLLRAFVLHPIPCRVLDPFLHLSWLGMLPPSGSSVRFSVPASAMRALSSTPLLLHPQTSQSLGPPAFWGEWVPRDPLSCSLLQELEPLPPLLLHASHPFPVTAHELGQWRGWQRAARQIIQGSGNGKFISIWLWKVFLDLQLNVGVCDVLGLHNTSNQILKRNQQGSTAGFRD